MVITRENTAPYPDNPRSEWVIVWREHPNLQVDGLVHFEYAVYSTAQSRDSGDLPFLLNSHKAMIRETHQRMVQPSPGFYRHISGIDIPIVDVREFLEKDLRAYRWVKKSLGEWEDDRLRRLNPFVFNSYWGIPEALDSQWVREIFWVPQSEQVDRILAQYLVGVEARRLSGDHRGTTLDLQVGASTDDADMGENSGAMDLVDVTLVSQSSTSAFGRLWTGMRVVTSALEQGDTIDVAYGTIYVLNAANDDANLFGMRFEKGADPGTFTNTAFDLSNRTPTDTLTPWVADGLGEGPVNTPTLVIPLQEVIDDYSPTAINTLWLPNTDVGKTLKMASYDNDTSLAYKLHIEYTRPIPPTPPTPSRGGRRPRKRKVEVELELLLVGTAFLEIESTYDIVGSAFLTLEESIPLQGVAVQTLEETMTLVGEKSMKLLLELLKS